MFVYFTANMLVYLDENDRWERGWSTFGVFQPFLIRFSN